MHCRWSKIVVLALCIGISGAASASPSDQDRAAALTPREAIERLVALQPGWPGRGLPSAIVARIEQEPEKFAPVIQEILALPDRLEDLDMDGPLRGRITYRNLQMLHHGVYFALGREHSEVVLVPHFRRAFELFKQAEEQLAAIREVAGPPPYEEEEVQAKFERLQRQQRATMSVMTLAVSELRQLNSPALVDDMLKFWEAGYVDRQSNLPRYPLMFAHDRADVIPRLKALMENPEIDRAQRMRIKRALEQHAATLREAEAEEPPGIRADPQDSAPDERKDEAPKR